MSDTDCDRCPAHARETWMHEQTGGIVRLCRHHGREHELALYDQGFRMVEAERVPA